MTEIESDEGGWGSWQDLVMCNTYLNGSHPHDFIVGFQLQVEQDQVLFHKFLYCIHYPNTPIQIY